MHLQIMQQFYLKMTKEIQKERQRRSYLQALSKQLLLFPKATLDRFPMKDVQEALGLKPDDEGFAKCPKCRGPAAFEDNQKAGMDENFRVTYLCKNAVCGYRF